MKDTQCSDSVVVFGYERSSGIETDLRLVSHEWVLGEARILREIRDAVEGISQDRLRAEGDIAR
jgi:hypothetical protein